MDVAIGADQEALGEERPKAEARRPLYPQGRPTNSMRLVRNTGGDRLADVLRRELRPGRQLSVVTDKLSLPAFQELRTGLGGLTRVRLLLPADEGALGLFGTEADRAQRNLLRQRWLAGELARWLRETVEIRRVRKAIPQGVVLVSDGDGAPIQGFVGSLDWSTAGLGLTASDPLALLQATETVAEAETIQAWFERQWQALSEEPASPAESLVAAIVHVKADRSGQDILFALPLNLGLNLCVPIEQRFPPGSAGQPTPSIRSALAP